MPKEYWDTVAHLEEWLTQKKSVIGVSVSNKIRKRRNKKKDLRFYNHLSIDAQE